MLVLLLACASEGLFLLQTDTTQEDVPVDDERSTPSVSLSPPATIEGGGAGLPPDSTCSTTACQGATCTARYPLEIVQPIDDPHARPARAYPGLPYQIDVAALGGAFPLCYTLASAPEGMTIDPSSGTLTWPSPVAADSPYAVAVQVSDQEGTVVAQTFSVTVTTEGFLFLDAVQGRRRAEGGEGTLERPFQSIADWFAITTDPTSYDAKYEETYPGAIVYYRSGTYDPADAYLEDGERLPILGDIKPIVHLAYPGETPIMDVATSHVLHYEADGIWWEGMHFVHIENPSRHALMIDERCDHGTLVRNHFEGMTYATVTNESPVMFTASFPVVRTGWALLDNEFSDLDKGFCVLAYHTERTVFEGNWAHDIEPSADAHHCLGLKVSDARWAVRDNRFEVSGDSDAIWLGNGDLYSDFAYEPEEIEVSWNTVVHAEAEQGTAILVQNDDMPFGAIWILRNTLLTGALEVRFVNRSTDGPIEIAGNVMVNDDLPDHVNVLDSTMPERIEVGDNRMGSWSDGLVDEDGRLVDPEDQAIYGAE